MLKRTIELIAIVCLGVFVPYLVFLLIEAVYPDFIFIPNGDGYGVIILRWVLGILGIGIVLAAYLIISMIYSYIRYGIQDDSNEESEDEQ